MSEDTPITNEQVASLLAELVRLRKAVEELTAENRELTEALRDKRKRISELTERIDELEREGKRQAAPFRRREQTKKPPSQHKSPGRKKGHRGHCRPVPDEDEVDHTHEVGLSGCPCCGETDLSELKPVVQYVEDIEARRVVHKITTYSGSCPECGRVRSHHPLQVSDATGAAGVQVGPNALAFALDLNKRLGVTTRKTSDILSHHLGISLSPGGLVQANHRLAGRLQSDYEVLIEELRESPALYVDETSWWVGEPGWWLWTFTNDEDVTVYTVQPRRNREVVDEILGDEFDGVLSSDCLNIYDHLPYEQQKCYSHHLKAVSSALIERPDSEYLDNVKFLLKTAMALHPDDDEPIPDDIVQRFDRWADKLLRSQRTDDVEEKIRRRLLKQREHLFTFLSSPEIDPTNNAAERSLRPAVVARKVSCGNRTVRGKQTWEITASLARTCDQREDEDFARLIRRAAKLMTQRPHAPPN